MFRLAGYTLCPDPATEEPYLIQLGGTSQDKGEVFDTRPSQTLELACDGAIRSEPVDIGPEEVEIIRF